jgi:phosphate transport system ATP-binding protein
MEKIRISNLNVWFDDKHVLKDVSMKIESNQVTAIIGPSGCGKTTLIRCINRMNDLVDGFKATGHILLDGEDVYDEDTDIVELRRKVGMIFQKPNPFPMSIYENIAFGPRLRGMNDRGKLDELVRDCLEKAALYDEVKDRLHKSALKLSVGQQQRLCIARALANNPEVILMDEPSSALDPAATTKIEALMRELRNNYTIVVVTHNMLQAARVSDFTGFVYLGELIEFGETKQLFERPKKELTERYISGRIG